MPPPGGSIGGRLTSDLPLPRQSVGGGKFIQKCGYPCSPLLKTTASKGKLTFGDPFLDSGAVGCLQGGNGAASGRVAHARPVVGVSQSQFFRKPIFVDKCPQNGSKRPYGSKNDHGMPPRRASRGSWGLAEGPSHSRYLAHTKKPPRMTLQ